MTTARLFSFKKKLDSKLLEQVAEWKSKSEAIEKREAERRQLEERKHADEVAFLQRSNKQLKTQLEQFISIQKK